MSVGGVARAINEEAAKAYMDVSEGRVKPVPLNRGQYITKRVVDFATAQIQELLLMVDRAHQSDKDIMSAEIKKLRAENELIQQNTVRLITACCETHKDMPFDEWEKAGGATCNMCSKAEVERLAKENTYLRAMAQRAGCPHDNLNENGNCKSGYPGCACMDDLLAATFQYEEDKVMVAVDKFQEEVELEIEVTGA